VQAYPTRALHNEICYDFVSKKRWCPHGAQCFRLHPLDKQKYLADVIHQSVVIWRTKYGHDRSHTLPSSIETQHANSVIALQPPSVTQYSQSSTSAIPTTALSPSPRFQNASGHVSRQGKSKSSDDEPLDNMKIKKTPWGDRAPSDTSSEGGQQSSDTGIWGLRFPSASDWDSPEISPPQAPSPPKISSNGVSRTNVTQASSKQSSIVPSENAQVRKRHPRPDTNEVCRKWLRDQCTLGYDCKYIHHTLDYDDPGPIPVRTFLYCFLIFCLNHVHRSDAPLKLFNLPFTIICACNSVPGWRFRNSRLGLNHNGSCSPTFLRIPATTKSNRFYNLLEKFWTFDGPIPTSIGLKSNSQNHQMPTLPLQLYMVRRHLARSWKFA